jgi:uncharacterized membrane protein
MKMNMLAVRLRRYLFTGFVAVVPVFLTITVLWSIFSFVDKKILGRFLNAYVKSVLGFYIPGLGFLLFILIILFVGFLANRFIGRKIFSHLERWFAGLPVIKSVYPIFKQIIRFISGQKEFGFRNVVMIEYPSKGIWTLAFLTNDQFKNVNHITGKEMLSIFVPTVPSPLSGFLVFVPREDVRFTDIAVEDALKIIISGGVYSP